MFSFIKPLVVLIIGSLAGGFIAFKAVEQANNVNFGAFSDPFLSLQLAASPQANYILSTDGTNNSWIVNSGGGGGGGGIFATTTYGLAYQNSWDVVHGATATTTGAKLEVNGLFFADNASSTDASVANQLDIKTGGYISFKDKTVYLQENNTDIQFLDANADVMVNFNTVSNAANYFDIYNSASGNVLPITANGSDPNVGIDINPKGNGNVLLGNFTFDGDQSIGAGQDNFVLTYDNGTGLIALEAATGGGGGTGLATSTAIADTYMIYGTSASTVGAEAAFTYDDATDILTVVNASTTNATVSGNLWANLIGNADTATALAANGANCSAGNSPLGVDASGAVESCFDVWTEAENTAAAYISDLSGLTTDNLTQGATNLYNQTHTGDVTGATALTIAADAVDYSMIDNTATLAGNLGLAASDVFFGDNGIIFEGATADTLEGLLTTADITSTDKTWTLPNTTGTIALLTSAMTGTFDGNNFGGGAIGTNELLYGSSAGTFGEVTAGTSGQLLQANGSGVPTFVSMSGDATIAAGGALSIGSDKITEAMLKAVDAAADEECLTYETTTGDFEWQTCGSGGGGTGTGTATTTDRNGLDGTSETITYSLNDFYIGGSASTTAPFNFDPESSIFTISSTTAAAASLTLEGVTILDSVSGTLTLGNVDAIDATTETTFEAAIDALTNLVTVGTITTGTWAANLAADTVDAITEIASAIRTGADAFLVTGTAGTSGNLLMWNADGDAVDASIAASDVLTTIEKSFTLASTTIDTQLSSFDTGTTTYYIWNPDGAKTLSTIYCKTDTGTLLMRVGDGTNWTETVTCSSSGAEDISLSNGSFTDRENVVVEIGSGASTPNRVTGTLTF